MLTSDVTIGKQWFIFFPSKEVHISQQLAQTQAQPTSSSGDYLPSLMPAALTLRSKTSQEVLHYCSQLSAGRQRNSCFKSNGISTYYLLSAGWNTCCQARGWLGENSWLYAKAQNATWSILLTGKKTNSKTLNKLSFFHPRILAMTGQLTKWRDWRCLKRENTWHSSTSFKFKSHLTSWLPYKAIRLLVFQITHYWLQQAAAA